MQCVALGDGKLARAERRVEIVAGLLALVLMTAMLSGWHPGRAAAAGQAGTFVSLAPSRVLDTRSGNGATGPVAGWSTIHVQIAGRGGVPAAGVSAVVINVTVSDAKLGGYITVYPDGTARPSASNLNFPAGDTRANLVTVQLGGDGKIALNNSSSSTVQLIGDVAGYYLSGTPATAGAFVALNPSRVLDTRSGNGATGPVAGWSTIHVQIAGRGGVPATGVSAVVINVTESGAEAGGYVTVYADGTTPPSASNLNFPAGDTRANLVTVAVGSDGMIALTNSSSSTVQLIGDVAGYYLSGTPSAVGAFVSLPPSRVLDTRSGNGATGPVAAGSSIAVQVAGRGGVPATGVSAVVINVTESSAMAGGYVTVYADGTTKPNASNLNFPAGDTRANLVTVAVGGDGKIVLTNTSGSSVQLIGDVAGYFRNSTADTTPPGPVTGLTATPTATSVALSWTNPTDSDFAGVMIRRKPGTTAPASPTDGSLVTTTSTATTSYIDGGLNAAATYTYALFTFDQVDNYDTPTITTVTTASQTTKPSTDWSFYVTSMNSTTASTLGCNQGAYDAAHGNTNSTVTLDFGGQNSGNTGTLLTFSNTSVTYAQIESYAENFAYNYWSCTGSNDRTSQLMLALGTNNSAYYVNSAGGAAWAGVVNTVINYLNANGYGQVVVWGASDIELAWDTYADTADWVAGYTSHTAAMYVDYGDAGGCPPYGSCGNGWTQTDVYNVAWGSSQAQAEPEIYYSSQAQEWGNISNTVGRILFWAPMDEYDLAGSTLTASQAWSALGCDVGGQSCSASTEIHKAQ